MNDVRKTEWMRPTEAAALLGVSRPTVVYRAGQGRYRSKVDGDTGVTLVLREDVEREVQENEAAKGAA